MSARASLSLALLAAAAAAGCSGKAKKVEKVSAERPPVAFPHSVHVDQGLECKMCHAKIESSSSLAEANLPHTKMCKDCHADQVAPSTSSSILSVACASCSSASSRIAI